MIACFTPPWQAVLCGVSLSSQTSKPWNGENSSDWQNGKKQAGATVRVCRSAGAMPVEAGKEGIVVAYNLASIRICCSLYTSTLSATILVILRGR